jgi:hypothetical protein
MDRLFNLVDTFSPTNHLAVALLDTGCDGYERAL